MLFAITAVMLVSLGADPRSVYADGSGGTISLGAVAGSTVEVRTTAAIDGWSRFNIHLITSPSAGVELVGISGSGGTALPGQWVCLPNVPAAREYVVGCAGMESQSITDAALLAVFTLRATGNGCIRASLVSVPGDPLLDTFTVDAATATAQAVTVRTTPASIPIGAGTVAACTVPSALPQTGTGTNTWLPAASMSAGRSAQTATLLPNGKVLAAGGMADLTSTLSSAELYDPAANTWSAAANMAGARGSHTATLLSNGTVLVVGGWYMAKPLASAELYDPATNTWSVAASMATPRAHHTATLLRNGKVLVTGGWNDGSPLASAELYDPATNTWSAAATMGAARGAHTATLLPGGKVLIVGGDGGGRLNYLATAELYDAAANSWSATAAMRSGRRSHTATLLVDGSVLVVGGESTFGDPIGGGYTNTNSAERYDPGTDRWLAAAAMTTGRAGHATLLPDGGVLVTGPNPSAELYDAVSNTWSSAGSMAINRIGHTATLLQNGRVLVAGDWNNGSPRASAELYVPQAASGTAGVKLPGTGMGADVGHGAADHVVLAVAFMIALGLLATGGLVGAALLSKGGDHHRPAMPKPPVANELRLISNRDNQWRDGKVNTHSAINLTRISLRRGIAALAAIVSLMLLMSCGGSASTHQDPARTGTPTSGATAAASVATPLTTSTSASSRESVEDAARRHIEMLYSRDRGYVDLWTAMDPQYEAQGYVPVGDFNRCHNKEPAPPHPTVHVVSSVDDNRFGYLNVTDTTKAVVVELTTSGSISTMVIHEVLDESGVWHWIPTGRAIRLQDGEDVNAYDGHGCPRLVDVVLSNELAPRATVQMLDLGRITAMALNSLPLYACVSGCDTKDFPGYIPAIVNDVNIFVPWGLPGDLATVPAGNGSFQLTYNGRPLFTYAGDTLGTVLGQSGPWDFAHIDKAGIP